MNSLTDHYSGQFLVRLVDFLSDDELIFLLLFETMISQAFKWVLRPPKPFNVSNFPFFSATQLQFSRVCLSSWWEVTHVTLHLHQKKALVLGCPGIRNSLTAGQTLKNTAVLIANKFQCLLSFRMKNFMCASTPSETVTQFYSIMRVELTLAMLIKR